MLFVSKPEADNFALNYLNYMPECTKLVSRNMERINNQCIDEKEFIWLEWANDLTAQITQSRFNAKVIVRVHDHEISQNRIQNVNWDNVDYIWFINRQAQEDFNNKILVKCKQFFLPNAFDPKPFTVNHVTNKHIGVLSIYSRPRKRLDRAIKIFRELHYKDQEWEMTIRVDPTGFTDEYDRLRILSKDLPINWDTHIIELSSYGTDRSQVDEFFQDKAIVLSTSDHEGFHYAIAEGIACGCYPVVYDWEWGNAKDFWGDYVSIELAGRLQWFDCLQTSDKKIQEQKRAYQYLSTKLHPTVLIPQLYKEIK